MAPCSSFRLIISSIRSTKSNLSSENFRANSISPEPHSSSTHTFSCDFKETHVLVIKHGRVVPPGMDQSV